MTRRIPWLLALSALFSLDLVEPALAQPPPAASKPFSDARWVGEVLYLSGQIGVKPGETRLVPGGMPAEARQAMDNIGAVLRANGLTFNDVFKCTVALSDMSKWGDFNTVYLTYFRSGPLPARNAFGANGLAYGGQVEIDCLAQRPSRQTRRPR